MVSRLFYFLLFSLLALLPSCFTTKHDKYMMSKGYDITKNSLIVKSYEYYKKSKGTHPQMRECELVNPLNVSISIRGYENKISIPINTLNDSIQLVLTDTTYSTIESGTLLHVGDGALCLTA